MIEFVISLASFVAGGVVLLAWLLAPAQPATRPIEVAAAKTHRRRTRPGDRLPETTGDRIP